MKPIIRCCYISGKITGEPKERYIPKFKAYENYLIDQGFKVVNPVELINDDFNGDWTVAMRVCLIELLEKCDCIFMLRDWRESRGARLEYHLAKNLGIDIYFQTQTHLLFLN